VGFTDMDNAVIDLHFYTHWPRAVRGAGASSPLRSGSSRGTRRRLGP
jgi:hypothetical protein